MILDVDLADGVKFANAKALLSVGYSGSWFENSIPLVRFDNPLRATDIAGGASVGQAATWPSNTSFAVNLNGSYKMLAKTRASAAISIRTFRIFEQTVDDTFRVTIDSTGNDFVTVRAKYEVSSRSGSHFEQHLRHDLRTGAKYRPVTRLTAAAAPGFDLQSPRL